MSVPESPAPRTSASAGPPAGMLALRFVTAGGQPFSLRQLAGTTFVLAHVERWGATPAEEAGLRAELRGLGAELVIVTPTEAIHFGPDDAPTRLLPSGPLPPAKGLKVQVIDAAQMARWSQSAESPEDPPARMVLDALRAAGEALRTRPPVNAGFSRRELLVTSLVSAFALALFDGCTTARPTPEPTAQALSGTPAPGMVDITLKINGASHPLRIEPRVTLLDALREQLGLTGSKKGCDMGQCGACTVLADGKRINACLALAVQYEGREITTIEGLAHGDELHPVQAAFLEHDAFQCGYCTPGQILSAVALLEEGHTGSDEEIREFMSGNLCRCGAYSNIVAAVRSCRRSG